MRKETTSQISTLKKVWYGFSFLFCIFAYVIFPVWAFFDFKAALALLSTITQHYPVLFFTIVFLFFFYPYKAVSEAMEGYL